MKKLYIFPLTILGKKTTKMLTITKNDGQGAETLLDPTEGETHIYITFLLL